MDRGINKETEEIVVAFEVGENASYQDKKDCWIAPKDSIHNWDELEELNIKEIPIHYVSEKRYKNWRGTDVACSPHFAIYPDSPAETIQESKEHRMLKDFIYNAIKNQDVTLIISKLKRKKQELTKIKIKDLNEIIDWNKYDIEITNRGYKTLRADVLLPFKQRHELLGYGIDFEIQLQNQSERITYDRSIKWALQGFSVVWLFENDFYFNDDKTQIELKSNELKVFSYSQELYFSGKEFVKNLKRIVIEQSRLLDNKLNEINIKGNKKIKELQSNVENYRKEFEEIYENIKKRIDGFFGYKIKELGNNFNEEVARGVQENFFENNKDKIKEIIEESINYYLKEIKLNEVIEDFAESIDYNSLIYEAKQRVNQKIENRIKDYGVYREFISNPPECNKCNSDMRIQKGKYGLFLGCGNYPICKNVIKNIPIEVKRILSDEDAND